MQSSQQCTSRAGKQPQVLHGGASRSTFSLIGSLLLYILLDSSLGKYPRFHGETVGETKSREVHLMGCSEWNRKISHYNALADNSSAIRILLRPLEQAVIVGMS